ncbi:peptidoglycan DD-metalloendopeptidase family protein [Aidingimonas lacisalsi]|uniref:peptidoglycan DD-metalloendopeptidase family protein n=1 Tax=Aidingimonas lacisalsi TaxID=2604086 RepID=UPI0011D1AF85|nr:peptidoglycan DD-metalloendopeptidase family protein [Aidingimonas lacisalsi]
MLRILHSLPRTHKLLLLPAATMVTVLGTQKIFSAFDEQNTDSDSRKIVTVPIEVDTRVATLPEASKPSTLAQSIQMAMVAIDELEAPALADIDPISRAEAAKIDESLAQLDTGKTKSTEGNSTSLATTDNGDIDNRVLHIAMQLTGDAVSGDDATGNADYIAGGTSYDDFSADPLELFDDGSVFLDQEIVAKEDHVPQWESYTIQQGDTFAVLAERSLGMGYSDVMELLDSVPDKNVLTHMRTGDNFEYQLDDSGQLLALRIMKNSRKGYLIQQEDSGFDVSEIERSGEATQRLFAGKVTGSFGRSAEATGLSAREVSSLSNVLEKKLDFRRDTRNGDRFHVLVESDIIDGESLDARVLAVHYEGERMDLTVVRNSADNRFYTPEGQSLDPAFSRYPFSGDHRISSSFNLRRKHPITGRISPHYGTDFAMSTGTPVESPADGRVKKVGNDPLAGRYLVIEHDNGYQSRYLHLSQQTVEQGERVSMGERIAFSGNTGRSTGPHLHYEIIVNSDRVDPMRVDLPESQNLKGEALASFKQESEELLARLENGENGTVVASTGRNREAQSNSDDT